MRLKFLSLLPLAMLGPRFATRRLLDGYFQRAGVRANVVLEIDSVDALQLVVENGAAAAFLPARMARRTARVRLLEVTDPKPVRAAGLIWRKSNYRSAASLAFVDHLTKALRQAE